jgi:hypothetical protein
MSKILFVIDNSDVEVDVTIPYLSNITEVEFRGKIVPISSVIESDGTCRKILVNGVEVAEPIKFY